MESSDEYYSSRTRLMLSCALLITWEFFGKGIKPDIDFEYLNLSIASEAIPFLLALFTLYSTYNFAFHWKLIEESKKGNLSKADYNLTLFFCFTTLVINYFYQATQSPSSKFLSATMETQLYLAYSILQFCFLYWIQKKRPEDKKFFPKYFMRGSLVLFILALVALAYEIFKYKSSYKMNLYETIYFYSFYFVVLTLFPWAAAYGSKKSNTLDTPQ